MSRFLLVSFSGLALAFYQLSGGADFTPPERPSEQAGDSAEPVLQRRSETSGAFTRIEVRSSESLHPTPVLRPVPKPRGVQPAVQPFVPLTDEIAQPIPQRDAGSLVPAMGQPAAVNAADDLRLQQVGFSLLVTGLQSDGRTDGLGAILQMESAGASMQADTSSVALAVNLDQAEIPDVRRVRASRVNIRFGPGTDYPVIARLLANDAVHVLNDDASGWVLLSDPKSGQVGWIAASLLSPKGS